MTKQEIKARAREIEDMSETSLDEFERIVFDSGVDSKTKYFLLEAIDKRRAKLDRNSAFVETSELRFGEI